MDLPFTIQLPSHDRRPVDFLTGCKLDGLLGRALD